MKIKLISDRHNIEPIYDPIQTHAVYGVGKDEVVDVKQNLRKQGCTRFRVVTANSKYLRIVCFKAPATDTKPIETHQQLVNQYNR